MASLHRHLKLTQAEHDRLGFRADCPYCQRRLLGRYPEARPLSRRGEAATAAGLVAASALLPAAGAMARQPGAPIPGAPPAVVADGGDQGKGGHGQGGGQDRSGVKLPPLIDNGDGPNPSPVPQIPAGDTRVEVELPSSSDAPTSSGESSSGSGRGSSGDSGGVSGDNGGPGGGGGQANSGGGSGGGGGQATPGGSGDGGSSGGGDSPRGNADRDATSDSLGESDRGRADRGGSGGNGGGQTGSGGNRGGSGGGGGASPVSSSDDAGPGGRGLAPNFAAMPGLPAPSAVSFDSSDRADGAFSMSSGGVESSSPDRGRQAPDAERGGIGGLFATVLAQALHALVSPSDSHSSSSDQAARDSDRTDRPTGDSPTQKAPAGEDEAREEANGRDDDKSSGDATHVVQAGESLWLIAESQLDSDASDAEVAGEVERLWDLNSERIGTGNPNLIYAGQELRL